MNQIILASASPRRKEIMTQVGLKFTVMPSEGDEQSKETKPEEFVKELSLHKAEEIAGRTDKEALIIGADTVVTHHGSILGKPKTRQEAEQMLSELQNDEHEVFTGVTLIARSLDGSVKKRAFAVGTRVRVTAMTMEQIRRYVDTGEPMDKAGAYAVQGLFAPYIESVCGDYYNIVGLPISAVFREAAALGIDLTE